MTPTKYGPCEKGENYLVVKTNEYGDLHIHPCGSCTVPFVWSESEQSFMAFEKGDDALRERLQERVKQAIEMRAAGFRREMR